MFYFSEVPKQNSVIKISGQEYVLLKSEPYIRKDGNLSKLLIWQSKCRICNTQFEVKTGLTGKAISKKCKNCVGRRMTDETCYRIEHGLRSDFYSWHKDPDSIFEFKEIFIKAVKSCGEKNKIHFKDLFNFLMDNRQLKVLEAKYMLRRDKKVNFINKLIECNFVKKEVINDKIIYFLND